MRNFLRFIIAFILLGTGVFLFLSCLSFTPTDESFNTVSDTNIQNWMGPFGAVWADILWQSVGYMWWLIASAFVAWGIILMFRLSGILKWRAWMIVPTLLLGCWLLTTGFFTPSDKTIAGVGGFTGYYLAEWGKNSDWYIRVPLWILVGLGVIFTLRLPVFRLTKWLLGHMGRRVENLQMPDIKMPDLKMPDIKMPKIKIPTARTAKQTEKALKITKEKPIKKEPASQKELSKPLKNKKSDFILPTSDLLEPAKTIGATITADTMRQVSADLESVLAQFGVNGKVVGANPGPVVTLYEFEPASGIKTSRVIALADDIAREMRALSVRIAVVPGSNTIGIEMPNAKRDTVYIRELVESVKFSAHTGALPLILGKNIGGVPTYADLAKMPHLLVAGTTGSGKSVAVNTMILSLLYRFTPAECRLILVDPKMVELSIYDGIPHLLTPVVTSPAKAVVALKWAVREMEDRYRAMSQLGVRNIEGFNQKLLQAAKEGVRLTRRVQTGFDPETGKPIIEEQDFDLTPIPYIVMIVDEMSDLMGQCGKEAEPAILRLAQMARAVGIHLILATQRPSVDVITGLIKANFPTRISFQVTNKIDSRTILDEQGAEQLLGRGDMLYRPAGSKPIRLHGPFVSDEDVAKVVKHLREQGEPVYVDAVIAEEPEGVSGGGISGGDMGSAGGGADGDLYDQAVAVVLRDKKPSISYVQRQLRVGYNKAADLIERMEREGVLSKPNVAGKRDILVPTDNA
ncbi:MAG: DNA translocase FtsK 4TM domain-containing protein [Alphaproteobacteria bacterium]|nr:DNA translocase FtsK 4TM domain-containing protein [Alphaproteobacteria bacterium]